VSYADRTRRPPRTLTDDEQRALLKASGQHADTFRDHVLFSLALGTGLREGELVALDLSDVADGRKVKRRIQLRTYARKGSRRSDDAASQIVHLPDGAFYKLEKFVRRRQRDGAKPSAPLFEARGGRRLSTRRVRELFHEWQTRAGFDHCLNFHVLRHTALTNAYRATKDIRIVQRVARHARIDTTTRYEHASDQEVAAAVRKLAS
jgi:integrase/recombinase XerC